MRLYELWVEGEVADLIETLNDKGFVADVVAIVPATRQLPYENHGIEPVEHGTITTHGHIAVLRLSEMRARQLEKAKT